MRYTRCICIVECTWNAMQNQYLFVTHYNTFNGIKLFISYGKNNKLFFGWDQKRYIDLRPV